MATAPTVTTTRTATGQRHAAAANSRPLLHVRLIASLPSLLGRLRASLPGRLRATPQFLRTVVLPALMLACRTAPSAALRACRTALPVLLLACRTAPPAVLRAVRSTPSAVRTAWQTRGVWWPALLAESRARLVEVGAGARARPVASSLVLLLTVGLVLTVAVTRPADLGSPRSTPAAHTAAADEDKAAQDQAAQDQAAQDQAAQAAAQPAPAPAPQCTVPAMPGPPAGVTDEQIANARTIAQVAHDRGLSERAVVIALATAQQESKLLDIDYGDRDSLGLFQQRPSQGWGSPEQVLDPTYAAGKFYDGLVQVPGWDTGRLTDVAQAVQRSGFPEAYQQWEGLATALAASITPAAPVCG